MEFMDDNEMESWNGFAKQKGEPGKGVEWKIKAVYDNGESIFAFGKDEYPLNGKEIIIENNTKLNCIRFITQFQGDWYKRNERNTLYSPRTMPRTAPQMINTMGCSFGRRNTPISAAI